MSIAREDSETTFLIDGVDNEFVDCYSCSIVYVRKLREIADGLGVTYETPYPGAIRVRLPIACLLIRSPRKITPEFREKARERGKAMGEARRILCQSKKKVTA